jgi:hypothetical protein
MIGYQLVRVGKRGRILSAYIASVLTQHRKSVVLLGTIFGS